MTPLLLIAIYVLTLSQAGGKRAKAEETITPPKTSLSVSLERQTIRENEPLPVVVSFSNDSSETLTDVKLTITGPSFIEWHENDCDGAEIKGPVTLDPVPAYSSLTSRKLCLKLNPDKTIVGSHNLLFSVEYLWKAKDGNHRSVTTSEKPISVDLFGTDKIIGVPLAFAGFIVPGLFFWFVLRLFKVPFSTNMGTEEKLIFSIIVSVLCMGLMFLIRLLFDLPWMKYFDISSDISLVKLLYLALAGSLLGLVFGVSYKSKQEMRRKQERALIITPNDTRIALLKKILGLNPDYNGTPVLVRLRGEDKCEYVGSHWAKTADTTFLVGAFRIVRQDLPQDVQDGLKQLSDAQGHLTQNKANLINALNLVNAHPDSVQPDTPVVCYAGTNKSATKKEYFRWNNEEVSSVIPDWNRGIKLLDLA